MEAISTVLKDGDLPHLQELSLANNKLRDRGASILGGALQTGACVGLQKLNLAHNGVELAGSRDLADAIIAVRSWHHPLELSLVGNQLSTQTVLDLQQAFRGGYIARPNLGDQGQGALSPPKKRHTGYSNKRKPDSMLQKAERVFAQWLRGELQLHEGTPDATIALLLQYVGLHPARKATKRVRLAQLLEALVQCPVVHKADGAHMLMAKQKVLDGMSGCHILPAIVGRTAGGKAPSNRDQKIAKEMYGRVKGPDQAVFDEIAHLGTPIKHVERPRPACNTIGLISSRSPIYKIHGAVAVDPSLKL
jgi:hypothetical protein